MREIFDELISMQKRRLLKIGREIIPYLSEEDILQPFDYPELENNGFFRYEEGVLHGLQTAKAAVLASEQKQKN